MASEGTPKILQTCIDVPRIQVPKRTFLPLSLGSLQRWGYVHPQRLEVKDLACAKLKETLWFCMILHQKRQFGFAFCMFAIVCLTGKLSLHMKIPSKPPGQYQAMHH